MKKQICIDLYTLGICVLSVSVSVQAFAQKKAYPRFYHLDSFERTVPVPRSVQNYFTRWMKKKDYTCGKPLLSATNINLNYDRKPDLLLRSDAPCLKGADNYWFWLFTNTGGTYKFVLFGTGSYIVTPLRTRTKDFRDIQSDNTVGIFNYTIIYHFSGCEYRAIDCKGTPLDKNFKPYHFPCRQ